MINRLSVFFEKKYLSIQILPIFYLNKLLIMNLTFKNLTVLPFNKKILLIIVNYNKKIVEEFKNIKFIETYYISNNKGYSICCLDNN